MVLAITFDNNLSVRGNSTVMEVAQHLATTKTNYSTMNFIGFPEVVIVYPVGKRLHINYSQCF